MGVSTDAILAFGIDLGEDWEDKVPWDSDGGFEDWYATENGLPEWREDFTDEESTAHWDKMREIMATAPVEDIYHCSGDYPMVVLAIPGTKLRAARGYPEVVGGLPTPSFDTVQEFKSILRKWGVDTQHVEPSWLLFSNWG